MTSSFQRCAVAVRAAISHGKTQWAIFHRRTALSLGHDSHKRLPNSKESVYCAQSIIRKRRAASPTSPFEGFLLLSPSADLLSEYYVPGVSCLPNALVLQAAKGTFSTTLEAVFSSYSTVTLSLVKQMTFLNACHFSLKNFLFCWL